MLEIDNISKSYGQIKALIDISFHVSKGEIVTLIGPSGSGKTTLLRIIAGFEKPDGGTIVINEKQASSPEQITLPNKRNLSMIFQDLALWPHMTTSENIRFVMNKKTTSQKNLTDDIKKYLESVNLTGYEMRYPHQLSGGEKQRLAIARALASSPGYVLMDEPFSHLDHLVTEDLMTLIKNLKNEAGFGILYVTHNIDEARMMADRIVVIKDGSIHQIGDWHTLFHHPDNDFVARFIKNKK